MYVYIYKLIKILLFIYFYIYNFTILYILHFNKYVPIFIMRLPNQFKRRIKVLFLTKKKDLIFIYFIYAVFIKWKVLSIS